ncbi:MAG TPA: EVE domain-containing protein, partial [Pirellulales bacterium]|nr:EVE domain-containing protein [Pirellulales bacterium]
VSWVSLIEDARESLLRSRWDLVIVDEAHKMSARSDDHKTYAYKLGESLSKMTDHFLLMTATPHKGDPAHFRRFLALLDPDVYGSIESLEQAMRVHEAPFYLRRTKEALVSFPDADTGEVRKLFTKREVRTAAFDLDGEELEFYDELTRYVEDQSIAAAGDQTARGRAVGFTMAMLQRRMASSIYAVRRSLERMRDRRQKILDDPEDYRREQIDRRMPDDFDDLTEEEQERIVRQLEDEVLSADPAVLRDEIARLSRLIEQAQTLEGRDQQSKLLMLRAVLMTEGVLGNPPRTERGRRRTLHTRSPNCHARISAMTKATGDWWVFYRPNELEDAERLNKGRTYWWRCNEKTAKGDVALLYVRGPTSALTAVLKATSDAYQDDSAQEFTTHRWCCDVRVVQVLKAPLTIGKMRRDRELWKCWGLLRANFQAPKPPRVPSEVLRLLAKHVPELGDVLKEPRSNAKRRGRSPSRSK